MNYDSILSDFLIQLNVPHTRTYCCNEFRQMPFQSLFGLGKLLACYGVDSQGVMVENKHIFSEMSLPFLGRIVKKLCLRIEIAESEDEEFFVCDSM